MAFTIKKCLATKDQITVFFSEDIGDRQRESRSNASLMVTDTTSGNTQIAAVVPPYMSREVVLKSIDRSSGDRRLGSGQGHGPDEQTRRVAQDLDRWRGRGRSPRGGDRRDRSGRPRIRGLGEAFEDAVSYPVLTEPISFAAPSAGGPVFTQPSGRSGPRSRGSSVKP